MDLKLDSHMRIIRDGVFMVDDVRGSADFDSDRRRARLGIARIVKAQVAGKLLLFICPT